jgi:predicted Zn-dependent peptidase
MPTERSIQRRSFDNRLVLVTERVPTVRSATLGIWVKMGSRFEAPDQAGISHFIEHMLFKGTRTRTARQIAFAIDAMGGQLDAFTSKEQACYYANVLDVHVGDAFELLADIVLEPLFDAAEMERERAVILEELAAVDDSPEELLWEEFSRTFWLDHPLGIPVLGSRETVEALAREDLAAFFRRAYEPANVVIAASGNLEHEELERYVAERFGALTNRAAATELSAPRPFQHFRILGKEELEQVHVAVGCPAPAATDARRYAVFVLNAVLGGSVSSRLFQRIREEQGLAYNVYSALETYFDAGCIWIYAATRPDAAVTVLELILEELAVLSELPVPGEELSRMKENLKGNVMLGLESTAGRMSSLAQQEIYFGRAYDMDEIIAGIDSVSAEPVQALARELFRDEGIAVDLLARRQVAAELGEHFADGLTLPGGGRLGPAA